MKFSVPTTLMLTAVGCCAALVGCVDSQSGGSTQTIFEPTSGEASLLELLAAGPESVPHRGERLVEIFDVDAGGQVTPLQYREQISVNASGAYSLEPIGVDTPVLPDAASFLIQQEGRAGYMFRYRDFRIRDFDQLVLNYHLVAVASEPQTIAGRAAELLSFSSVHEFGYDFEVWVDSLTGLALSTEVFDPSGALVQRVTYTSYVDGPPAGMVPHRPSNQEQLVDLGQPLAEQLGFPPALAQIVPDGYVLQELASVVDGDGVIWSKATYTDGIRPLFLLGGLQPKVQTAAGPAFVEASGIGPVGEDRLLGYKAGRILVLQGSYGDLGRIAVGDEPADEMQAFLESSLP
ncbi:sigma-E factor regulatory protein RseB domain-containing protein [Engelhardtia mirabilis]|uniref:MucB/RseB N-terminal domain-containing protein n=1 Tax=Engelhardtia mirabilis TaxID=2528011 RepID=A0A518BDD8_9BACT|nr:hypothetical protein Pla133_00620 [Planctomycetes bacterium Pla133]QDU99325.1 hypothetical protein Pla86_00620 [Planctomycetes bacterium Pla86]